MEKGFKFDKVPCPECGEAVAENWLDRHIKQKHPNVNLVPSPGVREQLKLRTVEEHIERLERRMRALERMLGIV